MQLTPYEYQEYPKQVNLSTGLSVIVQDEDEERQVLNEDNKNAKAKAEAESKMIQLNKTHFATNKHNKSHTD